MGPRDSSVRRRLVVLLLQRGAIGPSVPAGAAGPRRERADQAADGVVAVDREPEAAGRLGRGEVRGLRRRAARANY